MPNPPEKRDRETEIRSGEPTKPPILLGVRSSAGAVFAVQSADQAHQLDQEQELELLSTLKKRFRSKPKHYKRQVEIDFARLEKALKANPVLMWGLYHMEETGGQPDVMEETEDEYIFADYSKESPCGRWDLTYDQAVAMAEDFGMEMFDEAAHLKFKQTGTFNTETSDWVVTRKEIRDAGNALIGSHDGIGHVGAQEKTLSRGWRGLLKIPKKRKI